MRRVCGMAAARQSRGVVFSEQSEILAAEAKARGYERNLWVDEATAERAGAKPGERPTTVAAPKSFELVNVSQLTPSTLRLPFKKEPAKHTGVATQRPYSALFAGQLEKVARERNFGSKWWVPPSKLKDIGGTLLPGEGPHRFFISGAQRLFNAAQLADAAAFDYVPISSKSGNFYRSGGESAEIAAFNRANGARAGLVFTEASLARYGLTAREDAAPLQIAAIGGRKAYSVEDVVNHEEVLAQLGRRALPASPQLLMSGAAVSIPGLDGRKNKYAVTAADVELHGWTLRPGASGYSLSGRTTSLFSVRQLADPAQGFRVANTQPPSLAAAGRGADV